MKLYSENQHYKLYEGNMLDMLEVIEPNSIDSIITDPPYGLTSITKRFGKENSAECKYGKDGSFARLSKGFMGKEWDGSGIEYNIETWKKCYKVLKPGGYLLAFGGSRTFHRIACAIEDAGFEIKNTIMWLYGSGFPKSMNIGLAIDKKNGVESKIIGQNQDILKKQAKDLREGYRKIVDSYNAGASERNNGFKNVSADIKEAQNKWNGWGTALKPSFEPIIVARKPFKSSLVDNVIEYGVGGINIDECRVGNEELHNSYAGNKNSGFTSGDARDEKGKGMFAGNKEGETIVNGRFPANTILTYDETDFDEVCGGFPYTKNGGQNETSHRETWFRQETTPTRFAGDSGSASRYFYCAKASKKDRDEGLENFTATTDKAKGNGLDRICEFCGASQLTPELCKCETKSWITKPKKNIHPTVKPTELMQYLVRLVSPNGATILDPFNGSGSTGKAVMYENRERNKNYKYIGIELTPEYLPISKARIEYVCNLKKEKNPQLSLFDEKEEV